MNIEQIKTDLSAGVIVSPATWRKLVEAALIQKEALRKICYEDISVVACTETAMVALETVEAL